jgi:hypothetical protein
MHLSTFAQYLDVLDRIETLLPCRNEQRLKAELKRMKLQLLTLEPEGLRAVWQEFR